MACNSISTENVREKQIKLLYFILRRCGTWIPHLGMGVPRLSLALLFHRLKLIEQSFVADFEDFCCLASVPTRLGKNPFDSFPFRLHRCSLADLKKRWHYKFG